VLTILLTEALDTPRQHRKNELCQLVAGANLTPSDPARHVEGDYGTEGWGFESLRARSVLRQTTRPLTSGNAVWGPLSFLFHFGRSELCGRIAHF